MTNAEIIYNYLEKKGLIDETTGFPTIEIHTYAAWKQNGFQVKKGAKSEHSINIWKRTAKKVVNEKTGEEEVKTSMFMTKAAFFTKAQVERIAVTA